ncbi:MAG: hypothetical protein HY720_32995 [Planctomycetes bacterium]|nr:hypothetical protein [Planctomycetota bacterium]
MDLPAFLTALAVVDLAAFVLGTAVLAIGVAWRSRKDLRRLADFANAQKTGLARRVARVLWTDYIVSAAVLAALLLVFWALRFLPASHTPVLPQEAAGWERWARILSLALLVLAYAWSIGRSATAWTSIGPYVTEIRDAARKATAVHGLQAATGWALTLADATLPGGALLSSLARFLGRRLMGRALASSAGAALRWALPVLSSRLEKAIERGLDEGVAGLAGAFFRKALLSVSLRLAAASLALAAAWSWP